MTASILFGLFAATLFGIAVSHKRALPIAMIGFGLVLLTRLTMTDFSIVTHAQHEWRTVVNLFGLLVGFALLANFFERSHLADKLTAVLPGGRMGGFLLLVAIAVLSSFLDNIAAALVGGSAAMTLFRGKIHIGYIAAIVAASNAGGAGSVVGDTTTTMIWIAGYSPLDVAEAAVASLVAVCFCGCFAARQQHALQPLVKRTPDSEKRIDYVHVLIFLSILTGAILANVCWELPAAGVWIAILLGGLLRGPDWKLALPAAQGACFLLSLVLSASMMPVEELPQASPWTAMGLGVVSAFFDNIPLTALAIKQGGYDMGYLAYCVGFGGSMLWFGSSAGVAITSAIPGCRSAKNWLTAGWHVTVSYFLGFLTMLLILGWHPHSPRTGVPAPHDGSEAHGAVEAGTPSQPPGATR